MLSDRCLSVCPVCPVCPICLCVCNVGVLQPNGWMDQDKTWHAGKPRPWPQCVRGEPARLPQKGTSPIFGHICCGKMTGWIKMPLGKEVGLDPGNIALNGDPAPPPPKRGQSPPIFGPCLLWPNGWWCQFVRMWASAQATLCYIWPSSPQEKGDSPQFSAHVYCGQTAGCIRITIGTEAGLSPGNIVHTSHYFRSHITNFLNFVL